MSIMKYVANILFFDHMKKEKGKKVIYPGYFLRFREKMQDYL